jgi:hypothetical protein
MSNALKGRLDRLEASSSAKSDSAVDAIFLVPGGSDRPYQGYSVTWPDGSTTVYRQRQRQAEQRIAREARSRHCIAIACWMQADEKTDIPTKTEQEYSL